MTRTQLNSQPNSSPRPRLTSVRTCPVSPLRPPHGEAEAMQAAAARARRLLASPAASGIPGILSAPIPGRASCAEGVLLHRLDGAPASPSSPHHARGFSSSCFASRSPCELPYLVSVKCVLCAFLASQCAARGFAWRCILSNWWWARGVACPPLGLESRMAVGFAWISFFMF